MGEFDIEEVRQIQMVALSVLKEFDQICKTQGYTYFAIGGTCIGAIRHKGFIPWDDDVDVAMPIDDYYKFLDYCRKNLKKPYGIIDPQNIRHYFSFYHKMQDCNTTFVEEFAKDYPDRYAGVYIDIFPVSGLPKDEMERKRVINRNEYLKKINYKLRFSFRDMNSAKGKLAWLLAIPLRCYPFHWATDKQHELIKKFPINTSDKVWFPWRDIPGTPGSDTYKNLFYYEDFSETIQVPFENITIMVPKGYDRYLKMDFGDYMKVPPENKRIPGHPKALVDLHKPYSFYAQKRRLDKQ